MAKIDFFFFYRLFDSERNENGFLSLQDHFNKPSVLQEPGVLDGLLRGLATQPSQQMDPSVVDDVSSKMLLWVKKYLVVM